MKNNVVNKNEKYVVDIIDYGIDGEGIAKIDGFTIFVQNAMRGEKCEILILKVLKTHAFAKIVNIIEKSKYRVEPDCKTYKTCGGCSLR
ncbi:MAG: TRAM domain-containing protein, partial [Clostridiales bacterium]|nr:TRAM domain-containing protein [Clostridiales bacterium]